MRDETFFEVLDWSSSRSAAKISILAVWKCLLVQVARITQAFDSCRATLQRLADRRALQGAASSSAHVAAQPTHVPRPDMRPACKADIGLCQCNALWSSNNMQLMQHKLQGRVTPLDPKSKLLKEVCTQLLLV